MDEDLDLHEPEHDHLLDNDDDLDDEFFDDEDLDPIDASEGECEYCGELTESVDRRGHFVCGDCADFD